MHADTQPQAAVATQQGHQPRAHGHEPAAAEFFLPGFAVFEQLGVQAEARVDEEHPLVDQPHLHRLCRLVQQHLHRRPDLGRNAVGAAEVVERALWQHAEMAAAAERGLGHRVDAAVAAGGHHDAAGLLRAPHCLVCQFGDALGLVHHQQVQLAAGFGAGALDRGARLGSVTVARADVEDDEQRWRHERRQGRFGRRSIARPAPLPCRREGSSACTP